MTLVAVALVAGFLIGLSLGALGAGGSILAVPVLVYLLGQSALQATTGSLVVVAVTALTGAVAATRAGKVRLGQGVGFGLAALGGTYAGARLSVHVADAVLLASFSALMLVVAVVMGVRLLRAGHAGPGSPPPPILQLRPEFVCACPRALRLLLTATVVGLLTGFLGVGGGFLVVPALVLALGLPLEYAVGTSLVVITITSLSALAVRVGHGVQPDWRLVGLLTLASVLGSLAGSRWARAVPTRTLSMAFTALVLVVAAATATQSLPALA